MVNFAKFVLLNWAVFTLVLVVAAQDRGQKKELCALYDPLPQEERIPFSKGLERVLSLHEAGNWPELYKYAEFDAPVDKQEFVQGM
ncbi:MAG TPA: hypothetical protein VF786_05615, partial [Terriglobales bacterium]